jgi:hypothetical protein
LIIVNNHLLYSRNKHITSLTREGERETERLIFKCFLSFTIPILPSMILYPHQAVIDIYWTKVTKKLVLTVLEKVFRCSELS